MNNTFFKKQYLNINDPYILTLIYTFTLTSFFVISWFKMVKNSRHWKNKYNEIVDQYNLFENFNLKFNELKDQYNKKICLFLVTKNNLIKEKEQLELYIENLKKEISELEIQTKNLISNIELKNETKNLISNTNLLIELLKTQKTTFEIQDQKRPKRNIPVKNYEGMDDEKDKSDEDYVEYNNIKLKKYNINNARK